MKELLTDALKAQMKPVMLFPKPVSKAKIPKYLHRTARKARKSKKRSKLPSMSKLLKKADEVFSKWIRERDGYECFARYIPGEGEKCKGAIQNCHLIKRSFKKVRFDETNCNAGCQHHNYNHDHGFHARPEVYTAWYIKVYGALPYQDLVDKSRLYHKWTREELEEIIRKYSTPGQ